MPWLFLFLNAGPRHADFYSCGAWTQLLWHVGSFWPRGWQAGSPSLYHWGSPRPHHFSTVFSLWTWWDVKPSPTLTMRFVKRRLEGRQAGRREKDPWRVSPFFFSIFWKCVHRGIYNWERKSDSSLSDGFAL